MKKNILNPLFFIVTLFLFIISNRVQAQAGNAITISVKEIKYDDPNFTALRESLKKNPKVKSVKPSYTDGVAILLFMYTGEASQLWEEIPKSSKRFFDLAGMSSDAISLNYLNPKKDGAGTTAKASDAQTKTTNKKDCFDCDYFPLCKFDETQKYNGGHIYRGIRGSDGSMTYYNCEDGIVTKKWVTSSSTLYKTTDYNIFTDRQTDIYYEGKPVYTSHTKIILKSNVPERTMWESAGSRCTIVKKDTSLIVDALNYEHVIVVLDGGDYMFYAKGIGLIKQLDFSDYDKQRYEAIVSKGIIDPDLIGSWYEDKGTREYHFDKNGTGSATFSNTFFKWSVIGNTVYILNDYDLLRYGLSKSLPSITIYGTKYNRVKWKDPQKDTALNRQLIESQNFRFVATQANLPYPARQIGLGSGNELVLKKDSIIVSLIKNEARDVIRFSSSKYKYSLENSWYNMGYKFTGWKINVQAKDTKENFEFELHKVGIDNRDATLQVTIGNKKVSYLGYITDLDGN